MACGSNTPESTPSSNTEQAPVDAEPTVIAPVPDNSGGGTGELSREQKSKLAHATVRIWGVRNIGGKSETIYHGSGSIITPDGYILTNCHVADPVLMGYSPEQYAIDTLVIDLVNTEDKPPVATYIAEKLAVDPTLDLAVLKIVSNLDGSKLDSGQLNLPWVEIGDSDKANFGDRIYIFGFPSIGGDTITYSTGDISGFDSEEPVGNRAWIKTEATIAGGNSGGLAASTEGKIIGIPTQVGTGSANTVTDCRYVQDTNGDGEVNQKDTCVATGGFINGVRPINWAAPLIQSARNGVAYKSPYQSDKEEAIQPLQPSSDGAELTFEGWSLLVDKKSSCPVDPAESFPSGTTQINSSFSYQNIPDGKKINYSWKINGRDSAKGKIDWVNNSRCFSFSISNKGKALPEGDYALEIMDKNQTIGRSNTTVGGAATGQDGGVSFTGIVTDADTGDPIEGIHVFVLKPGVDPDDWRKDAKDEDIVSYIATDRDGKFTLPILLEGNKTYGVVIGNNKLGYGVKTGKIDMTQASGDTFKLVVELSK